MSTPDGGGGWIRTIEAEKQQIYSLPPLATRELLQIYRIYNALILYRILIEMSTVFLIFFSSDLK